MLCGSVFVGVCRFWSVGLFRFVCVGVDIALLGHVSY
jgi:hypothetical protein